MNQVCVITQPTFLPWLGWFDQLDQSETMVILDDVAFAKRSWQQRNRIRTRNGLEFVTVPVISSGLSDQKIIECELADARFGKKLISTLFANYSKATYFKGSIDTLCEAISRGAESGSLVKLNCALIDWIASRLDIVTPRLMASELSVEGARGEHLAAICERIGFKHYLSAPGAEEYLLQDRKSFDDRGVEVNIHIYEHPTYRQCFSPFLPYACALDLIFNEGSDAGSIMRSGRRPVRLLGTTPTKT